jgi:HD superfamily phosphohydrolase
LDVLKSEYDFNDAGVARQLQIIRLAALMHDLGHGPFSHAAEEVFPFKENEHERFVHEEYSASVGVNVLGDLIKHHSFNKNFGISIDEVTDIFSPASTQKSSILWKEIISGQMDADRMDYLLRDSYHAGVSYGRYDLDRVINTMCLCEDTELGGHLVGVQDDGIHAVEGLLIARYMMFTQVYFHKTRVIYDHHYEEALKSILGAIGGVFPRPNSAEILSYLDWDDWKVLAELKAGAGGEHGQRIMDRNHFRLLYSTPEVPSLDDLTAYEDNKNRLDPGLIVTKDAKKSWYKFQKEEIRVKTSNPGGNTSVPLATRSPIVNGLSTVNQRRIYVPLEYRAEAETLLKK